MEWHLGEFFFVFGGIVFFRVKNVESYKEKKGVKHLFENH